MRQIVCDTGPLLHLREAGSLSVLEAAGRICIPPAVHSELPQAFGWPEWLVVIPLESRFSEEALLWRQAGLLDPGEAEALALASQLGASWLLTDDAAARTVASQLGLEVHGSLGVILWAAATGLYSRKQAEEALEALAKSSLWVSARVLQEAREALVQIFSLP